MQDFDPPTVSTYAAMDIVDLQHARQVITSLRIKLHDLTSGKSYQDGIAEGMKRERARWVNMPETSAWLHKGQVEGAAGKDTALVYQCRPSVVAPGDIQMGWDQISATTYIARAKLPEFEVRQLTVTIPPVDAQLTPESGAWVHSPTTGAPLKDAVHIYQTRAIKGNERDEIDGWEQVSATQYLTRSKLSHFDVREIIVLVSPNAVAMTVQTVPILPTDEMLRAFLAVENPALFEHNLRNDRAGREMTATIDKLVARARQQYEALLASAPKE